MKKVFVITSGWYSEYGIDAIFSAEEKAREYIGRNGSLRSLESGDTRIEDYVLDERSEEIVRDAWSVNLSEKTGEVIHTGHSRHWASPHERGQSKHHIGSKASPRSKALFPFEWEGFFEGVSYESHEHALKLAVEARQAWLRKQAILKDPAKIG